ncbi:efflux RND transporter periplasmic adaptor subunit [bacterium]|nr:MAG: efflux RND transporter periplasmic adaptor subunit [bacterium]
MQAVRERRDPSPIALPGSAATLNVMRFASRAAAAVAVLGLLSSCGHKAAERAAPPPPHVQVATATERAITPATDLSGLVAPYQSVGLSSNLAEPALEVRVQEGDRVRRGQVLAILSTADLRANLEAAERNAAAADAKTVQTDYQARLAIAQGDNGVTSARSALSQAAQTLVLAQDTLRRDRELLAQGYVASLEVQQQQTQVDNDRQAVAAATAALQSAVANAQANGTPQQGLQAAGVAAARAAAAQARAQADQIRVQISKATIVAPVDGVVVNRNLNAGEYPGNRQVFTIQEIDRVYATLSAFAAQVVDLRQGAPVAVTSNSLPGQSFPGRVVALLSPTSPSGTGFVVKVDVANAGVRLRPGMAVLGHVDRPTVRGIAIPAAAFLDDNDDAVMVVSGEAAHSVHVSLVASDGKQAVVRGLAPDSRVVVDGGLGLSDGEKVVYR